MKIEDRIALLEQYRGYTEGQISTLEHRVNLLNFGLLMIGLACVIHFGRQSA